MFPIIVNNFADIKKKSFAVAEVFGSIATTYRTSAVRLQPFVHTLRVELVIARQHAQQLALLKIAHTDDARRLVRLVCIGVETIRRQLFNFRLEQASRLGLAESFCQIEKSLVILGLGRLGIHHLLTVRRQRWMIAEHGEEMQKKSGIRSGRRRKWSAAPPPTWVHPSVGIQATGMWNVRTQSGEVGFGWT